MHYCRIATIDINAVAGETYRDAKNNVPPVRGTRNPLHISVLFTKKPTHKTQQSVNSAVLQLGEGSSQLKICSNPEAPSVTHGNGEPEVN